MPKKITIVSGISLAVLIGMIVILLKTSGGKYSPPRRVSVYLPERGEIVTPTYSEFLSGCVAGLTENGGGFSPEALKAVAIAENSLAAYYLNNKSGFENLGADFVDGEQFPYIRGESAGSGVKEAAEAAAGVVLTYEGEPVNVQMCEISTGKTDDQPPLSPSVSLPCDVSSRGFESRSAYTADEVWLALHHGEAISEAPGEWLHDAVYADNGTLLYIGFCDRKITGAELKTALGLRSTAITADFTEDKFYFTCLGSGNNRGMSLNAANYFAENGKTAEEILEIFYPNCKLTR